MHASAGRASQQGRSCARLQVERELPETAAMLRLSGLEMTDCMSEITGLGSDLSAGLRSTANIATMTEAGVRQGVQGVQVRAMHLQQSGRVVGIPDGCYLCKPALSEVLG